MSHTVELMIRRVWKFVSNLVLKLRTYVQDKFLQVGLLW